MADVRIPICVVCGTDLPRADRRIRSCRSCDPLPRDAGPPSTATRTTALERSISWAPRTEQRSRATIGAVMLLTIAVVAIGSGPRRNTVASDVGPRSTQPGSASLAERTIASSATRGAGAAALAGRTGGASASSAASAASAASESSAASPMPVVAGETAMTEPWFDEFLTPGQPDADERGTGRRSPANGPASAGEPIVVSTDEGGAEVASAGSPDPADPMADVASTTSTTAPVPAASTTSTTAPRSTTTSPTTTSPTTSPTTTSPATTPATTTTTTIAEPPPPTTTTLPTTTTTTVPPTPTPTTTDAVPAPGDEPSPEPTP